MSDFNSLTIRRALLSVSDKTNIADFARQLHALDVELLSTGGTARSLREHGLPVTEIADYTGFPEIMDGRVKTLHPRIHAGLLGRRGIDDAVLAEQAIEPIDLLVVNLYPFERTVARPDCDFATAVETIDIGGPAMLRAAAKNYRHVAVVTDPKQYIELGQELAANAGALSAKTRLQLAIAAFNRVAQYDAAISNYFSALSSEGQRSGFPDQYTLSFIKQMDLRYGENPHQQAALYREPQPAGGTLVTFQQRQGKALSYNNIADADAAWECVRQFEQPACVIVKHANPCGVAVAADSLSAYQQAFRTDPTSAFGGIIAFNRNVDAATAQAIIERQFVEVILAPRIEPDALVVTAAKANVRVLEIPAGRDSNTHDFKRIGGGLLIQTNDTATVNRDNLRVVSQRHPEPQELDDLLFAWRVVKQVKSNAIVYARDGMTIGIGAGQMSRVISARIAGLKAQEEGLDIAGSVMASDAFFPFRDGLDIAAAAGVRAVIQPGGSIRDAEVIAAADEQGLAMVLTGLRHFRH